MAKNWPVGTVVEATCVIIDYESGNNLATRAPGGAFCSWERPRIVAKPGDLGIVIEHCGSEDTHEVEFPGGMFTSSPADAAVRLYIGAVSTVCDGQSTHPEQAALFDHMCSIKGG